MSSYIISTAETASKKIGTFIHSIKLFPPKVALYHYKFTTWSCMEYCSHVWDGAHSCKKRMRNTVSPSLAASLEPLVNPRNIASLVFSIIIILEDVHPSWLNSFFHPTARLWNSLPIVSFPLTYDLHGFKSRINRHLLSLDFFSNQLSCMILIFLFFFFL